VELLLDKMFKCHSLSATGER